MQFPFAYNQTGCSSSQGNALSSQYSVFDCLAVQVIWDEMLNCIIKNGGVLLSEKQKAFCVSYSYYNMLTWTPILTILFCFVLFLFA